MQEFLQNFFEKNTICMAMLTKQYKCGTIFANYKKGDAGVKNVLKIVLTGGPCGGKTSAKDYINSLNTQNHICSIWQSN